MKKIFLFLTFIFCAKLGHSGVIVDQMQNKLIRSSAPVGNFTLNVLSTGIMYVETLIVVSSGTSAGATFQLFDTTTTVAGVRGSSSPVYTVDSPGVVYPVKRYFKYGIGYGKTNSSGKSTVEIKYDWTYTAPTGKQNEGY